MNLNLKTDLLVFQDFLYVLGHCTWASAQVDPTDSGTVPWSNLTTKNLSAGSAVYSSSDRMRSHPANR